jgi:peptidoglycan/LPS O-acetylase OafA/YrhL
LLFYPPPPEWTTYALETLKSFGVGPGTYYVLIYLQFFLLLPLCGLWVRRMGRHGFWSLFVLALLLECICAHIPMPAWLYRLLFVRYAALIPLGLYWAQNGIRLQAPQLLLSLLSVLLIVGAHYLGWNFYPLFPTPEVGWNDFHSPMYFYPAFLLGWLMCRSYEWLPRWTTRVLTAMGRRSYEIFLWQMVVFTFYPYHTIAACLGNRMLSCLLFILLTTVGSILPCLLWPRIKGLILH